MSTSNQQTKFELKPSSSSSMPSSCSNNTTNNNNNNANSSNNNQTHIEQPKTKRQKIEKVKLSVKTADNNIVGNSNESIAPTSSVNLLSVNSVPPPPPDILDTGEIITKTERRNVEGNNQLCSSLSSSAHSISSTPSSLNNSPSSTPSSSRTASLTQLLNVQNSIVNNLPINSHAITSIACTSRENGNINNCSFSSDEVDRIGVLPDLLPQIQLTSFSENILSKTKITKVISTESSMDPSIAAAAAAVQDMRHFEQSLMRQCLCGVSEDSLQRPFQSHYSVDSNGQKRIANLSEWPTNKLLQFLSNLQLLFDIYLKQNSKGFICARIMDVCDALIRNDRNLIDEIIVLAGYSNAYVQFLAGRVLASFLVIAKQELDDNWLKKLVDNLFIFERLDRMAIQKIHFSLEIIKRVVEWKDIDLHPLEDEIVDTRSHVAMNDMPTVGVSNLLESHHALMNFQARQPTLDTNYFSVHFRSLGDNPNESSISPTTTETNGHDHELSNERRHHQITLHQQQQHQLQNFANMANTTSNFSLHGTDISTMHLTTSAHTVPSSRTTLNPVFRNQTNHSSHCMENRSVHFPFLQTNFHGASLNSFIAAGNCNIVTLTDSESFDTTALKCNTIKILENKWPALVRNMSALIANHMNIDNAENCVLNFLQLWENIISVKANLSIVETLPFYAQLDKFESLLLNRNLSCIVYKQMLCLFNEALCYGSTLALQDMLPEETCMLAHQIVRHVKDFRILESLPRSQPENVVGLIGFKRNPISYENSIFQGSQRCMGTTSVQTEHDEHTVIEMDKTILQKMVLLVLKSIAVTVKEIRSDSSDSSIDSTDYDAFQDMVLIERSIRDVLRKLEMFIKNTLEFHPECHFSKILRHLFDDQDDHLIEAMVCTLDVTSVISFRNNAFPELVSMLNPVYTFLEFLNMISNSSDLLLDFLVSNETCFLLYLLRFLKYIRMNWTMFVQSCQDFGMGHNVLEEAMSVLIRLRLQISRLVSRQLYPYDISPILRLLESCESLYEGNELS